MLRLGVADYLGRPLDLGRLTYLIDVADVAGPPCRARPRPAGPDRRRSRSSCLGDDRSFSTCPHRDGAADGAGPPDRPAGHDDPARRRDRHGQDPPGRPDPRALAAPRPAVPDDQLRGAVGQPDRERDVRPRQGGLHRRRRRPRRQVRRGRPRHPVPGRDRLAAAGAPGQAAAGRRGAGLRAGRVEQDAAAAGPADRRQQPPARRRRSPPAGSAPTCSTGSTSSPSPSRRCASGAG